MSDNLFSEFNKISGKEWKQKIQYDLKGVDYNDTLIWESNEGIKVKPFYHQDDFEAITVPAFKKTSAICQSIFIDDEATANFLAKDALKKGATSIAFEAKQAFDISKLLKDLDISKNKEKLVLFFKFDFLSPTFINDLISDIKNCTVFLNIDPIGNLAKFGNWYTSKNEDFQLIEQLVSVNAKTNILSVDVDLYQNAGANCVQQIAYGLAHANEYLNVLNNSKVIATNVNQKLVFNMAVGGNYFFEIAKIRALRYLWSTLNQEYTAKIDGHFFVQPSMRNKTLYDYNVNMLRSTSEVMSAVLGGATTISNLAYDRIYHKKNEFGERIARNQLLILQEESYFKEAAQFVDGAYYVEALTQQLAEKALIILKNIEQSGGFLKQLFSGKIQQKIEESAAKELKQFESTEEVLLGTNRHPNQEDRMKDTIELYPFVKTKPRKTLIKPIIAKRLAETVEQERLAKE